MATTIKKGCLITRAIYAPCQLCQKRNVASTYKLQDKDIMDRKSDEGRGKKNLLLLSKAVSDLSRQGKLEDARKLFDQAEHRDSILWNLMIRGYIENGMIKDAREIFDRMGEKNTISWNSMIMAYAQDKKVHIALKLFLTMPEKYKDIVSWTTIINGLAWNSLIEESWLFFKRMPIEPNSISWSSIISGFQRNGLATEALILFIDMLSLGVEPTSHSFTSALTASADLSAISLGQQLYCHVVKRGLYDNIYVSNATISMFIRSGHLGDASCVFNKMCQRDVISWNSMIMGYAQHGYDEDAIMIFHQMQKAGFQPDRISFLGVLHGCSHRGSIREAEMFLISMEKDYDVPPKAEHYACMVDLLARAGLLKEAAELIHTMPFESLSIFWRSLLNGCRIYRDFELGIYAATQVLELESENAAVCMMAAEMYEAVGRCEEAAKMRRLLKGRGAKKELGCSWIEIRGKIHLFTTRDETHIETSSIHKMLELLAFNIREV